MEQVLTATVDASACRHLLISTNPGTDLRVNGALINYADIRPVAQFGLSLITTVSTKRSRLRLPDNQPACCDESLTSTWEDLIADPSSADVILLAVKAAVNETIR